MMGHPLCAPFPVQNYKIILKIASYFDLILGLRDEVEKKGDVGKPDDKVNEVLKLMKIKVIS